MTGPESAEIRRKIKSLKAKAANRSRRAGVLYDEAKTLNREIKALQGELRVAGYMVKT